MNSAVTIDVLQPVPLGTTVVLVCRVVGVSEEDSSINYCWIVQPVPVMTKSGASESQMVKSKVSVNISQL